MGNQPIITRRMAVSDLGKAGIAIMLFGAACSDDGSATGTTVRMTTSTSGAPTTSGPVASLPTTTLPVSPTEFHRVDLDFVSAYILYRGGEAVLIDTGVSGSTGSIGEALGEIGLGWDVVGQVILTHKHPDHVGSLPQVAEQTPGAPLYAGAADAPLISAPVAVTAVGDGDRVFDLDIIESPGHTPGHICVLDPVAGVLVAGDALNGSNGGVGGADPAFSEDMAAANATVTKLAGFEYEVALFGHGDPLLEGASLAVADLAASLG
jgi:glyoxylase-like metal-dependent hydrolase (beta-lactamase superfamily II)